MLGAVCLACFPGTRARVERVDWPRIVLLGLTWMAVPLLLYPVAQQWVDSSTAGAINGTMPLFSAALAALLLRRLPGPAQLGGLAVGFTGVLLVTLSEATGAGGSPLGIGLLLFSTVLYAVAFNLAVPLTQRYGSLPVLLRAQLVAVAFVPALRDLGLAPLGVGLGVGRGHGGARGGGQRHRLRRLDHPRRPRRPGARLDSHLLPAGGGHAARHPGAPRGRSPALAIAGVALVIVGAWLSSRREA